MAVSNGARFIEAQLNSILPQLSRQDEVVISDDHSQDESIKLLKSFQDPRIRILPPEVFNDPSKNFEYTLSHCRNEYIFFADQDDIWHSRKIEIMLEWLQTCDLAVCDCRLVDENGNVLIESFFSYNHSRTGLIKNIMKNSFVGCCMAFHRRLLPKILPFPSEIGMYDQWVGLIALRYFRVSFIPQTLVDHRRHGANYSTTGERSTASWNKKVISRLQLAKAVL